MHFSVIFQIHVSRLNIPYSWKTIIFHGHIVHKELLLRPLEEIPDRLTFVHLELSGKPIPTPARQLEIKTPIPIQLQIDVLIKLPRSNPEPPFSVDPTSDRHVTRQSVVDPDLSVAFRGQKGRFRFDRQPDEGGDHEGDCG